MGALTDLAQGKFLILFLKEIILLNRKDGGKIYLEGSEAFTECRDQDSF